MKRLLKITFLIGCAGLLSLAAPQQADAGRNGRSLCFATEQIGTRFMAGCHGTAINQFEKFKWDFMRRLDRLGSDASDEDKQDLVDLFCTKVEIRGDLYRKRVIVKAIASSLILALAQCDEGQIRNILRRGKSYLTLIEVAIWDCCREFEDLAGVS